MLVIRLQRRGKKNQPFFWIVLTEKTAPVKGKYIEKLGYVNPLKKEFSINKERVRYWLSKGVKISDTVYNLLIEKNILEGEKRKIKIKPKKKKGEEKKEEVITESKKEEKVIEETTPDLGGKEEEETKTSKEENSNNN